MNILQICNKPPFPAVDGGAIAMNNTTQGLLNNGHKVSVLAISTSKHPIIPSSLSKEYVNSTNFQTVFIDTSIRLRDAFFNLFTKKSYNIERFISKAFADKIQEILLTEEFDIIIFESLFVSPYISKIKSLSKAKIVLRAHNVEHKIWERISKNTRNPLKKRYINLLAKRLKNYEIEVFEIIDGIAAMTKVDEDDFKNLGFKKNIVAIPTGYIIDNKELSKKNRVEENSIFHIASMDWLPNIEGVDWFLNNVWPKIANTQKQATLYLAGREMPDTYFNLNLPKVKVVGKVKSAKDFYLSKKIMIVPVLSGSGMRIKIIEGMALGKVIISTSIGAEGINCTSGENILIADNPDDFAEAICKCLKDPQYCDEIGGNAERLIESEYRNEQISKKMISFFENLEASEK
jgi:glycosyltransferase involved in cell wall biosynthesis